MVSFASWLNVLYHTTSYSGFSSIVTEKQLIAKPFISFSEKCLFSGDIQGKDICLGFDRQPLLASIMKVNYTEKWFNKYPEHGSFIAGEGWREQFAYEGDEEDEEEEYRLAELDSFLWKAEEKEWISKAPYHNINFIPNTLKAVIVTSKNDIVNIQSELAENGYKDVEVRAL